jgi:hypothetical protein
MTPEQVAALSACWRCPPDQRSAILFLLATIADMTLEEVIAGSSCWKCVPDFPSAELFLLDTIATNGTGGGGGASGSVLCAAGPPVAAPTTTCAIYVDLTSTALYFWTGAVWQLKV